MFNSKLILFTKRCFSTAFDSFKAEQLKITLCSPENRKPKPDVNTLLFGHVMTDHILKVYWSKEKGWSIPEITPFENFSIHPAAKVFHYAIELFEGTKAYYGVDSKIRIFRPDKNIQRMLNSTKRISLPVFDGNEFLTCIKKFIEIGKEWVPQQELTSLYIRPTFIGIEPTLGVAPSSQALLYVIASPVGSYFKGGLKSVSLYSDPKCIRAFPGGVGNYKLGANYGPTVYVQMEAEKKGYQQVLWLQGEDNQLSEVGTMNILVYLINEKGEKELITPSLEDGTILPGVTRDSILTLTRDWGDFKVTEGPITMNDIIKGLKENRILEIFGCGTACVVSPVNKIHFKGQDYLIPTDNQENPLYKRILKAILDIQYGKVQYRDWAPIIC